MSHYEKLKALKMGLASDFYTALYARSMSGSSKEYERYISGEPPLILSDSVGKPLAEWSITGSTVQDGTPTPEQPIEVKGVGDKTGNLISLVDTNKSINGLTVDCINNTVHVYGTVVGFNATIDIPLNKDVSQGLYTKKVYLINGSATGLQTTIRSADTKTYGLHSYGETAQSETIIFTGHLFRIQVNKDLTIDCTFNIMLNEGSEPLPYEPYGYKITEVTRGKNYFNPSTTRYEYAVRVNEVVSYPGGAMYFIKAKPGKYTFKAKDNIPLVRFGCVSEPFTVGTIINNYAQADGYIKDTKMTIDNDCDYLMLQISGAYVDTHDLSVIQIELGTTATEYEPYIEPITTAIYLNSPLMADEVIDSEGKREVEWGKKDIIIEKTTPYDSHVLGICNFNSSDGTPSTDKATRQKSVCDRAPRGYAAMDGSFYVNNVNIVFVGSESDTINELKDRYDGAVVYYPLNTPTSETISVPTIPTLKGNTVLDVDTEVQPTNMSVTYKSRR